MNYLAESHNLGSDFDNAVDVLMSLFSIIEKEITGNSELSRKWTDLFQTSILIEFKCLNKHLVWSNKLTDCYLEIPLEKSVIEFLKDQMKPQLSYGKDCSVCDKDAYFELVQIIQKLPTVLIIIYPSFDSKGKVQRPQDASLPLVINVADAMEARQLKGISRTTYSLEAVVDIKGQNFRDTIF